jgi:hypothetical protein
LTEIEYEGAGTKKKGITPEPIIGKLREVYVLLSGRRRWEVSRKLAITEQNRKEILKEKSF